MSLIDPHKLTPNPANAIFDALPDDVYAALKADIVQRGLLNPILVTSDFTVIAGHHRLRAALELGFEQVPVDIQDVDPEEAEDRLIADNVLRRQLNPMEQARLIQRLKERAGIKRGKNNSSRKIREELEPFGLSEDQADWLNRLNQLIPPLQALITTSELKPTAGSALAQKFTPEQQQDLYDILGPEGISRLKAGDIQSADQESRPSHTESEIRAILNRVKDLQSQKDALESRLAEQADPGDLQDQLDAVSDERDTLAAQVERLQNAPPTITEKLVEKVVKVETPVADPEQAATIARLEQSLADAQGRIESLIAAGSAKANLQQIETEKRAAEKQLAEIRVAMARAVAPDGKADQIRAYRAAIAKFVEDAQKRVKPIAGEWQRVGGLEPLPANWMLYREIQILADGLEAIATGLRRIPLDAAAQRKHHQDGQVIDIAVQPEGGPRYDSQSLVPLAD